MTDFLSAFKGAFVLNAALTLRSSDAWKRLIEKPVTAKENANAVERNGKWRSLIFRYLVVYLLATSADWLQGAYIYVLYHSYGYSQYDIAILFVAGFGSSAVFGSFIGGMADSKGRRLFVVVYGMAYALSCAFKHFQSFYILLIGRVLGGIATSLLFSIFESWLIRAHADSNLKSWISKSFTWAAYGNSIVAIASGIIADHATETSTMHSVQNTVFHIGGYLVPFDLALVVSVACGVAALYFWEENYGTDEHSELDGLSEKGSPQHAGGLRTAFFVTIRSREILLCGIVSCLYEGSMYIFIFMWTPALMRLSQGEKLPFGLIFSTFMVCSMAGSSLFSIFNEHFPLDYQALFVLLLAAASMVMLLVTTEQKSQYTAMNLFEFTIGMYFPVIGCLKSAIVPESQRAAIYNLYRIPLNLIVLLGLLADVTPVQSFTMCLAMLLTAAVMQVILIRYREKNGRIKHVKLSETDSSTEESDVR
uniref:Molybdate-anion transporter n=1 Tax=Amphora coffeiformis TaxID=265554 RepID=A0A7S3L5Q9_9STRA|mmetsp:Transcript_17468/g.33188  ORF Transcript_17468/g.33188 Transcript_17468/m.33188 type:complete len:478 (-) Transcript_17468:322-1755(-)